jgi:chromosome segregation ATPase
MEEALAVHEARRILAAEFTKKYIERQTIGTVDFLQVHRSTMHVKHGSKADPFKKVKSMIKSMLENLEATQARESKHAAWCDKELSATAAEQARKDEDIQKMNNRLDALTAELTEAKDNLLTLSEDFDQLKRSLANATAIRSEEHEREVNNIKESKNAIHLLKTACKILKNYFDKQHEKVPQEQKSGFKKRKGMASGIIGLLEIAISDFEKQLKEAEEAEEISKRDYQEFKSDSEVRLAVFQKDLEYTDRRRVKLEYDEAQMTNDLKSYEKEAAALKDYMQKLKAQCVVQGPTYEERQAKMTAELANLKDALKYLSEQ